MLSAQGKSPRGAILPVVALLVLALVVGVMAADTKGERGPAMFSAGLFLILGLVWIRRLASPEQVHLLTKVFLTAFVVRLIASFALHYGTSVGTFAEDDYTYHVLGERIAAKWQGEYHMDLLSGFGRDTFPEAQRKGYPYVVGFFYYIFGKTPLVPKVFNVFMGSMLVIYLGKFCWDNSGQVAGKWTLWFATWFPSMILWSGLMLKDCLVTFGIIYVLYHGHQLALHKSLAAGLRVALGLMLVGTLRGYMFILLSGCIILSFFIRSREHVFRNYLIGIFLVLVAFFMYRHFEFGRTYASVASFEALNDHRRALASGNSAIHVDADISSPGKAIVYLPIGVLYFLFAPFPWTVKSIRQLYSLPEVLAWYCVFYFFLKGIWYAFRNRYAIYAMPISLLFTVTLTYSLVEGNLGTAYRHRFQVMGYYLMFTAIGIAQFVERRQEADISPALASSTALGNPRGGL